MTRQPAFREAPRTTNNLKLFASGLSGVPLQPNKASSSSLH